jgi:hypothetical protein
LKYAVGNRNNQILRLRNDAWESVETTGPRPTPRYAMAICTSDSGDDVIIFGGATGFSEFSNELLNYKNSTSTWAQIDLVGDILPRLKDSSLIRVTEQHVLICRGRAGGTKPECHLIDLQHRTSKKVFRLPNLSAEKGSGISSAQVVQWREERKAFLIGGLTSSQLGLSDFIIEVDINDLATII